MATKMERPAGVRRNARILAGRIADLNKRSDETAMALAQMKAAFTAFESARQIFHAEMKRMLVDLARESEG